MLFFRYHAPHRGDSAEPWQQASRPSARRPHQEEYHGWRVEVTHRRVGITVRRKQYRAVMRNDPLGTEHSLTGFPSKLAALEAARRWIDCHMTRQRLAARRRRAEFQRRKAYRLDRS